MKSILAVVVVYLLVLWGARTLDAAHEYRPEPTVQAEEEIYYGVCTPGEIGK